MDGQKTPVWLTYIALSEVTQGIFDHTRGVSMPYDENDAEYDHRMEELYEYEQDAARMKFYDELTNG